MKNPLMHRVLTSPNSTIVHNAGVNGPSNSSAARWTESSASPDSFAAIIRDRFVLVQNIENAHHFPATELDDSF